MAGNNNRQVKDSICNRLIMRVPRKNRNKTCNAIPALDFGLLRSRKRITYLKNILETEGKIPAEVFLELSLKVISDSSKSRIRAYIKRLEKAKRLPKLITDEYILSTSIEDRFRQVYSNELGQATLFQQIFHELQEICQNQETTQINDDLETRLCKVCSLFDVDSVGKEILLFFYLYATDTVIERLADNLCEYQNVKTGFYSVPGVRPIAYLIGLPQREVANALANTSPLMRAGLLETNRSIAPEVHKYLEGYCNGSLFAGYFSEYLGESIPLESHTISRTHREVITSLILNKPASRGVNILFYGKPGTGKTEFCRSLGSHLHMPVYEIKNIHEEAERDENRVMFRFRALLACQRSINRQQSLIVVDEADAMLNTDGFPAAMSGEAEKGQINKILDDSTSIILWITNRYYDIDESTRRRFDYSVKFENFDFSQRKWIWNTTMQKYGLPGFLADDELDRLAAEYAISAGGIDVAVRHAVELKKKGEKKDEILNITKEILNAHREIILGVKNTDKDKNANSPVYSLEGLNVKTDMDETLMLIDKFNQHWRESSITMMIRNMNILLYGPPGSGKTEFAKSVARTMKRRLLIKRASDLLNCYLGETEKSIKTAFREAEREQAILFIDEADSLFGSRDNAVRSWEISQVNEMLTHMETFRGMLICATNFRKIIDSAAIRRFNIKLEFDYLRPDGNMEFYRRYLAPLIEIELSDPEITELRSISALTPGDFKIVYQQNAFFEKSELSHQRLIQALKREVLAKNEKSLRKMGF